MDVVWIVLIKIAFECIITKMDIAKYKWMDIVECICRSILNIDINLNKKKLYHN